VLIAALFIHRASQLWNGSRDAQGAGAPASDGSAISRGREGLY
jgi:hypothetical protein